MKIVIFSFCLFLLCFPSLAQQHHHDSNMEEMKVVKLIPELGNYHHPINTKNPKAQKYFDQGMMLIFGFNHGEAIQSFKKASELDPNAAMPHWGVAYALGSNINIPMDVHQMEEAFTELTTAKKLAVTEHEKDNIEAFQTRYSNNTTADIKNLNIAFKNAMKNLVNKYPDDLEAAVIYADALMNINPWKFWSNNGKPNEGTDEIINILESVLKRNPNHVYANHLYIHTMEASPYPERALPSASRIGKLAPLEGHLVHMPFHIYIRTGQYHEGSQCNLDAIKADQKFFEITGSQESLYGAMYYNHDWHSLVATSCMEGKFAQANMAAKQLYENAAPLVKDLPMAEFLLPAKYFVLLRFNKLDDILKLSVPPDNAPVTTALFHFAKGVAFAKSGKVQEAENEQTILTNLQKSLPKDVYFSLNSGRDICKVASFILSARIEEAKNNITNAINIWHKAVDAFDSLAYDEPPGWYYPVRESLGAALYHARQYENAEKVFRKDLEMTPRNGRSLFGLYETLKAEKKNDDAAFVFEQFKDAWQYADVKLEMGNL